MGERYIAPGSQSIEIYPQVSPLLLNYLKAKIVPKRVKVMAFLGHEAKLKEKIGKINQEIRPAVDYLFKYLANHAVVDKYSKNKERMENYEATFNDLAIKGEGIENIVVLKNLYLFNNQLSVGNYGIIPAHINNMIEEVDKIDRVLAGELQAIHDKYVQKRQKIMSNAPHSQGYDYYGNLDFRKKISLARLQENEIMAILSKLSGVVK